MPPMLRPPALAAAAFAALVLACGGSNDPPSSELGSPSGSPTVSSRSCAPARPVEGRSVRTVASGGLERSYILRVPQSYDGARPAPLVVGFHSFASGSEVFETYTALGEASEAAGFIAVMPEGTGEPRRWNTRKDAAQPDDVAFVRDLLAALDRDLCIDENRVYLAGYSNGGGMAQLVACEMPERIAAVAVVAATYLPCTADVPMLAFHGLADPVVPFEGGANPPERGGGSFPPVRRSVSEWAQAVGCDGLPRIARPSSEVEVSTFVRCRAGDGEVLLYSIINGGHTWPGATAPLDIVGPTTQQVKASDEMLRFFAQHPPAADAPASGTAPAASAPAN